jgi:hypothetical protein
MLPIKFNFAQIADLQDDLRNSPKALRAITAKITSQHLAKLRNELRSEVPARTGALRKTLAYSVKRSKTNTEGTWAIFGFLRKKRGSAQAAVAAGVLQKGKGVTGDRSKYGKPNRKYIWLPLLAGGFGGGSGAIQPSQFFSLPGSFIGRSKAGNTIAFQRVNGQLWPMFVLKQQIKLSRPPLELEFNVEDELPEITADIQQTVADVLAVRGQALRQLDGR